MPNAEPFSEEVIQRTINNLPRAGFAVYVVINGDDGNLQLKKMNFWETETHKPQEAIRNKIFVSLKEKYIESKTEFVSADFIADNQNKFYIVPTDDNYDPFSFLSSEADRFSKNDIKNAKGIMFCFINGTENVWIYQHLWSIMVPNKTNKNILGRIFSSEEGDVFENLEDPILTITEKIDLLIIDGHIVTDNYKLLQQSFGFKNYITRRAKETINSIKNKNIVANPDMLDMYIDSGDIKIKYAKKMMRIADSKVLEMEPADLFTKIDNSERWKNKFKREDEKLHLENYDQVELLIDLLDERYLFSAITDAEYDTEVKQVAAT